MADAEQYRPMTARQLYDHMRRFADDGGRSGEDEVRWLASKVSAFVATVAAVMNSRLEPDQRTEANAFRAAEIEKELEGKRREVDRLEQSLKQIRAA